MDELSGSIGNVIPDLGGELGPAEGRFNHAPVMAEEVIQYLAKAPQGLIVDATLGLGGHAKRILAEVEDSLLLGLDRDPAAIAYASSNLEQFKGRTRLVEAPFSELAEQVEECVSVGFSSGGPVGILADLGVSSMQLDDSARGFSIRHSGPLDMRMDSKGSSSAESLINGLELVELIELFKGQDEPHAARIARAIVASRPLATTEELAELIEHAVPYHLRRGKVHPATRVFQAVRIAVNHEVEELQQLLQDAVDLLLPGGVFVVLSYHSGEDRAVKAAFSDAATGGCLCPKALGCVCGAVSLGQVLTRGAKLPSKVEIAANPRARSARLRAFLKGGDV